MIQVQNLIEAGVHFGHRVSRWHPQMKPFIFGKRNQIHIIDIRETIRGLVRACNFLTQLASQGRDVVLVGTKRQAKSLIQREAQRCGMHFVSERWLGGTLTNFNTIRLRLRRLEELESLESTGEIDSYSKKRISALRRERRKITRNLDGIRNLKQLPGALLVVDIRREHISVREAKKVGIPVIGLVDTDCDPRSVDIVIPGNDDAYRAVQQILRILTDAIIAGRDKYVVTKAEIEKSRLEEERARTEEAARKAAADRAAAERAAAEKAAQKAAQKTEGGSSPAGASGSGPAASGPAASGPTAAGTKGAGAA